MKYGTIGFILFYLLGWTVLADERLAYPQLAALLAFAAALVYKERFRDTVWMSVSLLVLAGGLALSHAPFAVLLGIPCYDLVVKRLYPLLPAILLFLLGIGREPSYEVLALHALIIGLCGLVAYSDERAERKRLGFQHTLDNERRLRYELESAKSRLMHAAREIAAITEIRERNRIARQLHDSIGHDLTGILIQLQAAHKLYGRDDSKAQAMLERSISGLADSVEHVRNTVHNIVPRQTLGLDYLQSVAKQFAYCPVHLQTSGDFNAVLPAHLEIIGLAMKEALTNVARHSGASAVDVAIDAGELYTRLHIRDNGKGADPVKEGMGLGGIRERIRNLGGQVSISGSDGFRIVCVLPREGGGGIVEAVDRG